MIDAKALEAAARGLARTDLAGEAYYDQFTQAKQRQVTDAAQACITAYLAAKETELAAEREKVEKLRHIATDLVQHLDWLTRGLPAMLEDAALTDEEGLIGAAVDAANSARATLAETQP